MTDMTAVLIEDSPLEGNVLAQILRRLGVNVLAMCEDGPSGLAAIRLRKPTIATVDNQLTGMNGIEVVRILVAEQAPTKLVMCSGTAALRAEAMRAGAVGFIAKPYDNVVVKRELSAFLGSS